MTRGIAKCLPVLLAASTGATFGQSRELWLDAGASIVSGTNRIGSPLPDGNTSDVQLGNGYRLGFRFDWNAAGCIGHEFQYAYNRTELTDNTGVILSDSSTAGMAIHQLGYNLLYRLPAKEGAKLRPFVTAGIHLSDFVLPGSASLAGSSVKPGGNFGVGAKLRLSQLFGVRFDLREYVTGKPNWDSILFRQSPSAMFQTEATAGIGIHF
jgi:hypothetical protein